MANNEIILQSPEAKSWLGGWCKWTSSDENMLLAAEKKIFSYLKTAYHARYVDIGPTVGTADKIWTITLNEASNKTPIVLLHGLAAAIGLWCLNLDAFASTRPVHAIDVLGFGRSSRPDFSTDALEAERQLVQSVEDWRREMQLDEMILLGHSMGGFIAASYAIRYPDRVKHLILADPWGFPVRPDDVAQKYNLPFWVKAIAYIGQQFNPLTFLRAAGPYGQRLLEKARPDIIRKFEPLLKDDTNMIPQYIYQCNAQKPSGESAFHAMMSTFGWAKYPMINRLDSLRTDIPMTLIYGSRSWVDNSSGDKIKEIRGPKAYVNVVIIAGAGHHVYADKSEVFNKHVVEACQLSDNNEDRVGEKSPKTSKSEHKEDEPSKESVTTESTKQEVDAS